MTLERLNLGKHTILYNTRSRAVVLATKDACNFIEHPEFPGADEALSAWRGAGLFDEGPFRPESIVPLAAGACNQTLTFKGPADFATVALPEGILCDQIAGLLSFCRSDDRAGAVADCVISARDGCYTAYDDMGPTTEQMSLDEARFFTIRAVCEIVYGPSDTAAVLHGAAVAHDGSALLFLGQSGSGKTTAALGLLDAGCTLVADDFLPVHASGRGVMAFPTPLGLKGKTLFLPEALPLTDDDNPDLRPQVHYMSPSCARDIGAYLPVTGIVFPRYSDDAAFSLEHLPPEAAFMSAISEGGRINPHHKSAAPLVRLFNTVPAWELRFNRSEQSVPACISLFEKARSQGASS